MISTRTKIIGVFVVISILLSSCNSSNFKSHSSGLTYKFIKEHPNGKLAQLGDVIALKMRYTTETGELIEESSVFKVQLKRASHSGGSIEDALAMMHKGDSAIFKINTENFYKFSRKQPIPDNLINCQRLTFYMKVVDIISQQEFEKEQKLAELSNKRSEETKLEAYLSEHNIKIEPSLSGFYFIQLKQGKGNIPTPGKKVKVHYTGAFLNGDIFDSSYERNEPFEFYFGIGKVIQGWEEGLAKMKVGGKYQLIIPSYLAYGNQQVGPIPPNTTLIFNIELIDCE